MKACWCWGWPLKGWPGGIEPRKVIVAQTFDDGRASRAAKGDDEADEGGEMVQFRRQNRVGGKRRRSCR